MPAYCKVAWFSLFNGFIILKFFTFLFFFFLLLFIFALSLHLLGKLDAEGGDEGPDLFFSRRVGLPRDGVEDADTPPGRPRLRRDSLA